MQGAIVWFNDKKGFGFITPVGGEKDIFVHVTGLTPRAKLSDGQPVTFDLIEGPKGKQAINVKKIDR